MPGGVHPERAAGEASGKRKRASVRAEGGGTEGVRTVTAEGLHAEDTGKNAEGWSSVNVGAESPLLSQGEPQGGLERKSKKSRPEGQAGGSGSREGSPTQEGAGPEEIHSESERQRRGKAVTSGPRGGAPPGAAPRKRIPLLPSDHWGVYEDSTLNEPFVPSRLARFVSQLEGGPEVTEDTVEEFTDSVFREDMKGIARKYHLLRTMRTMLQQSLAELDGVREEVTTLRETSENRALRVGCLTKEVRELRVKAQALERDNGTLTGEVEKLKKETSDKSAALAGAEKKANDAALAIEQLSKDIERLRGELVSAEKKGRDKYRSSSDFAKHVKKAKGRAVEDYRKSQQFKDDAAALYSNEVHKLLEVSLEELKMNAPQADPSKFEILRSLFDRDEGEGELEGGVSGHGGADPSGERDQEGEHREGERE